MYVYHSDIVDHNWVIWPETDGLEQRCTLCGNFRPTPADQRPKPQPKYEIISYRVEWVFRLGWIGDAEGRTWYQTLKEEKSFPTRELADEYMANHPDVMKSNIRFGGFDTRYSNGQVGVFRREVRI